MSATYGYSEHRGGGSRNFGGGVGGERAGNLGEKAARKMNLCFLYSVFLLKYFQNCQRWEGGGGGAPLNPPLVYIEAYVPYIPCGDFAQNRF